MVKRSSKYLLVIMVLSFLFAFNTAVAAKDAKTMTMEEKISYAIGYTYFENLNKEYKLDVDNFFKGIEDAISKKPMLDSKAMQEALMAFQEKIRAKEREKILAASKENKDKGEAFLKENKKKKGYVVFYWLNQGASSPRSGRAQR